MTKEQLLTQFRKDYKNAVESQGKEIAGRLGILGKELYETPEEDLDKFVERNFAELKSLPYSGEAFRSYRKPEGNGGFASMFGYGSDDKAVAGLFGNGNRSWKQYDDNTLIDIAKKNGFGSLQEFKDRLQYLQDEYDEKKREEQAVRMNEDIRKARENVVEETLNPSYNSPEYKGHPLKWARDAAAMKIAKAFMPNIVEGFREDALEGKGSSEGNYFEKGFNFVTEHPEDVIADALITGTSFIPAGRMISSKLGLGLGGNTVLEGLYQGVNSGLGEAAGYALHDKEFDADAISAGILLGSSFEGLGELVSKGVKGRLGSNKRVAKVAKFVEDAFENKKVRADEYLKGKKKQIETYKNPKKNANSPKYEGGSVDDSGVTRQEYREALEAEELYKSLMEGRMPRTRSKGTSTREMTAKERHDALNRHPELQEFASQLEREANRGFWGKQLQGGMRVAMKGAPVTKAITKATTSASDRERQKRVQEERLVAKWMSGDLPNNYNDKDWKAYHEWESKNPDLAKKAKSASYEMMLGLR